MADDDVEAVGRPDANRSRQVEAMAGYGISADDIAIVLGVDVDTLKRDYRAELKGAAIKANAKVAESLFRKATAADGREGVTAAIFWLKTRAGWKETAVHEVSHRPYEHMSVEQIRARLGVLLAKVEKESPGRVNGWIESCR
ncbi:MAG: hypothetical protein AB7X49_00400 [Geminicoccaceae bacterium]